MTSSTDGTSTDHWLDDVREQAADRLARITQVQDELSTLSAEARTADGRVHVRVNAAGRPIDLTLEPSATNTAAPDLAAAILRAVDDAAEQAGERLAALVGTLVPSDELESMMTGRPTETDRVAVRRERAELGGLGGLVTRRDAPLPPRSSFT